MKIEWFKEWGGLLAVIWAVGGFVILPIISIRTETAFLIFLALWWGGVFAGAILSFLSKSKINALGGSVALILAIIVCIPSGPKRSGLARITAAQMQIDVFGTALDQYQIDTGSFPLGTNGLQALILKPAGATNWQGPYLKGVEIPMDPWQQPYIYRCPSKRAAAGFPYDLISLGPPGANAPIANEWR